MSFFLFSDYAKVEEVEHGRLQKLPQRIRAANGAYVPVMQVLTALICYFRRKVLAHASKILEKHVEVSDFCWVATVPAIWGMQAKQVVREVNFKPFANKELANERARKRIKFSTLNILCCVFRQRLWLGCGRRKILNNFDWRWNLRLQRL